MIKPDGVIEECIEDMIERQAEMYLKFPLEVDLTPGEGKESKPLVSLELQD